MVSFLLVLIFGLSTPAALAVPAYSGELSYQGIQDYVWRHNPHSAEELLAALPESLRSNFTLVGQSQALHGGCDSPEKPRIILFSYSAKLVIAFHGNASQPGCGGVELLGETSKGVLESAEITFDSDSTFSANPSSCVGCHLRDPKPLWKSYPDWAGTYGSTDDFILDAKFLENPDDTAVKDAVLAKTDNRDLIARLEKQGQTLVQESRDFYRYKQKWLNSPVFRKLAWDSKNPAFPYSTHLQKRAMPEWERPNSRLGQLISFFQIRRLLRQFRANPQFHRTKYGLAYGLLGCGPDFIDDEPDPQMRELRSYRLGGIQHYFADYWGRRSLRFQSQLLRDTPENMALETPASIKALSGNFDDLEVNDGLTPLGKALDEHLMLEIFSTDSTLRRFFRTKSSNYATRYISINPDHPKMLHGQEEIYSVLFPPEIDTQRAKIACPILKRKHKELSPASEVSAPVQAKTSSRTAREILFTECADCHVRGGSAPLLPFQAEEQLKTWLKLSPENQSALQERIRSKDTKVRMPRGGALLEPEIQAIEGYLRGLTND